MLHEIKEQQKEQQSLLCGASTVLVLRMWGLPSYVTFMSAGTDDFHCLIRDEQIVVSGLLCLQKVVYVYKVKLGQKIKDAYFF